EDISVPEPDEDCLVEPLSTKIKEIDINISFTEPPSEMLVTVAKYLLLRTPTLARLVSYKIPSKAIEEFVRAYSKQYPHLASIEYKLLNKN
ncbi:hypothetical protein H4R18_003449, partial [Coemansia javaensis]